MDKEYNLKPQYVNLKEKVNESVNTFGELIALSKQKSKIVSDQEMTEFLLANTNANTGGIQFLSIGMPCYYQHENGCAGLFERFLKDGCSVILSGSRALHLNDDIEHGYYVVIKNFSNFYRFCTSDIVVLKDIVIDGTIPSYELKKCLELIGETMHTKNKKLILHPQGRIKLSIEGDTVFNEVVSMIRSYIKKS